MKLIKAYIRPLLLEEIYHKLREEGYEGITVFKGEGAGQYSDPGHEHGSLNFPAMHSHIVKIEIAALDENVKPIIQIINKTACTCSKGDGIILVTPINNIYSIRDGKEGAAVLN